MVCIAFGVGWGAHRYDSSGSISPSGPAITAKWEKQEAGEHFMLTDFKSFSVHQLLFLQ